MRIRRHPGGKQLATSNVIMLGRIATAIVGVVSLAHADPPVTPAPGVWDDHHIGVNLALGWGTPLGAAGVAVDWTPIRWVSIEGGLGASRNWNLYCWSGGSGQAGVMARGRLAYEGWGVSAGLGASTGGYHEQPSCPFENGNAWDWSAALWINAELAIEHRWSSGVGLRLIAGESRLLNPSSGVCTPYDGACSDMPLVSRTSTPYFGLSFRVPL
jgi:hypothetical protein